jgi:hypothetical protein
MTRTIVFEFKDEDLERLDKLREAGYKFEQVMLLDKRGRERYVDIVVSPWQMLARPTDETGEKDGS